jgi:type II secretory ATPase GspE/PulE/Tfp pilus assembly ATPase PilB-like protein
MDINSILTQLFEMLKDASSDSEKTKQIKLVIENNSQVSQALKDELVSAVDTFLDKKEETSINVPEDLVSALAVDGMADYIESVKKEAYQKGLTDGAKEEVSDADEKPADETDPKEEPSAKDSATLIDSIVALAITTQASDIDMEDKEASSKIYKEALEDKNSDELNEIFNGLLGKVKESMTVPTESLDNETLSEDHPEGDGSEDEKDTMSDAQTVLRQYKNSEIKK